MVEGIIENVENADKLGGLVEDIRDAMLEYQVCIRKLAISDTHPTFVPDFVTARRQPSAHRESHLLIPRESYRITWGRKRWI